MANSSFGGSVKLQGESEYRQALSQISQSLKVVSSEMKATASSFTVGDTSMQQLSQKSKDLSSALEKQKQALTTLKTQLAQMEQEYSKNTTTHNQLLASYDKEKAKLNEIGNTLGKSSNEYKEQEQAVNKLAVEVQKSTSSYNAQTKALNDMKIKTANAENTVNQTAQAIDKLGKETEETSEQVKKAGDGFTVFKGILSNLGTQAINTAINGLKKMGSSVIDIGKQSIEAYGNFEQLTGGVETLFKNSADIVKNYANNAYASAGMSANQYMENVTGFSASMINSLGGDTKKAAELSNQAIIDMSDNANKMGTDMASIQNAYQGFAKGNYTINLMSA